MDTKKSPSRDEVEKHTIHYLKTRLKGVGIDANWNGEHMVLKDSSTGKEIEFEEDDGPSIFKETKIKRKS